MSVEVRSATSRRDLRAFVDLPFRLHANAPQWVPPLRIERRMFLHRRLNAFFDHGEAKYFLARRDGRVVGRVSAQVDHAYNEFHDSRWGWFGFLELEDDPEVMAALLEAAEAWLRERGCERMVGPADFTMNDESGIVIEGHERPPMIKQPWHPPYYQRLAEGAGLDKAMDLLMWELDISDREKVLPVVWDLADAAAGEHGVKLRKMTRRRLRADLDTFGRIYNDAWSRNWGFVPYGEKDLDHYATEMQLVYSKPWFMVAERGDVPIAMAITVPDLNQVLRLMKGRLLPFGWWHFLRRRRIIGRVRVGFLGVMRAHQHTGVAALLYREHFDVCAQEPLIDGGEMGWILETNEAMNRGMEAMGGRVVKRYRVYERML